MRTWPAVILAPLLALADQGVAYALVGWACATQNAAALNAVHLGFVVAIAATAIPAARAWRVAVSGIGAAAAESAERLKLLAAVGLMLSGFSVLVVLAMWMAHAALSPCYG